ncbi:unnamed protein product [Ectocarpus sp. CCAP 1310/34]|nr:unnamed protein product [Ectocarpus sp. CCAP 1310/34]
MRGRWSTNSGMRLHEHDPPTPHVRKVELAELPRGFIDQTSIRVKGSGHCTILHVSYSEEPEPPALPTQEEEDAAKARTEDCKQDIQRLTDELTVLNQQSSRNSRMREVR